MRRLIVTGDDFGLAIPVNEAIEIAHRDGILSAASLMIGAAHASDAVARARALPSLRVGLHVVVAEGTPVLPPERIPDLVDTQGELPASLTPASFRFFFQPRVRAQLEAEIRAQFEAFRVTGLSLDHVNAHNHMQLHPTVATLLLRIGREYGMRAMRLPARASRNRLLTPWLALLRRRLARAGVHCNDQLLGLAETGGMDEAAVLRLIAALPDGTTEMYFHPATRRCDELDRHMPGYLHEQEFAALTSRAVRAALTRIGVEPIAFGDL